MIPNAGFEGHLLRIGVVVIVGNDDFVPNRISAGV